MMFRKYLFLIIIYTLCLSKDFAQVNLQTGSAIFTLPMFNWQDDKSRLHFNMSLNYNSGNGLKVNDVASNAGQGWNLMAGGVITRMQNGEPDDQYSKDGAIDDAGKYPAGYLYNPDDVSIKGCPKALANYPIFGDKNHIYKQHNVVAIDRELDYFAFSFNGKNGIFILNKNDRTGYELGDSKVQISYELSNVDLKNTGDNKTIRTRISFFMIKDEDGLIYRFGAYQNPNSLPVYGLTKVLKTAYCDVNGVQSLTQPSFKSGNVYYQALFNDPQNIINPYIINSWYLTEIDDPFTNKQILFSYGGDTNPVIDPIQTSITYYKEKDYSVISRKATQSIVPFLMGIGFPDNRLIQINYGAQRLDVKNEKVLSSIDILYNGSFLSEYALKTSYFIFNRYGTPSSDFEKSAARLCLLSVKKYGAYLKGDDNPYLFDYNLGSDNSTSSDDIVPPYSFPLKDIWGYYNGTNSTAFDGSAIISGKPASQLTIFDINNNNDCKGLCFYKNGSTGAVLNSKSGYAGKGLLRQVIYPTGGTLTYTYAQNTGTFIGTSTQSSVGGVHVIKTSSTDGGFSNGCDNPIITQYKYILDDGSSSLWGIEKPVNTTATPLTNNYSTHGHHYTWSLHNFPFGNCSHTYQYPGIMYQEEQTSLKWTQAALTVLSDVLDVVGAFMVIKDVVAATSNNPVSLIIDVIFALADLLISCSKDIDKTFTSTAYYDMDLNGINPLPAQFKRVEIVPNTGDIGKTVETFTSSADYPLWAATNTDFIMQQRYGHWEYGLPKLVTTYNAGGNKVKEVEYNYDDTYIKHAFTCNNGSARGLVSAPPASSCVQLASCNCEVVTNNSQPSDDWSDVSNISYSSTSDIKKHVYYFYSGRLNVSDMYERIYKPGLAQSLQTTTHYDYDNNSNYPQNAFNIFKTTTTQSNGDVTSTYIKYSGDFPVGTLYNLDQNNSVSVPVETINSITRPGGTEQYLNDKITEFATDATGYIVPQQVLEQRFNSPQPSMVWYQGPGGSNPPYIQTQFFTYNANGNLTGIKDEGNHSVTNIYDYPDAHNYSYKYITASIINADPNIDKPAYTSFENTSVSNTYFGGWVVTGTVTTASYTASAITGNQSLKLPGLSLKASLLNSSKAYKLSFWATTSGNTVTPASGSAALAFTGPAYNGFTYYEYNITGTTAVTVAGTSTIDELRLYPKNSRMRSTTYDPLIGKTSECDENNRITYYEYDELGRLRFIKNETKNIVKMYEYNTISNKQSGCPGTYYNHLITETFTKSICTSGYQGNPVTYTIPANKYSSLISQADADQQAENELNTNGQTNANNTAGACSLIYYNRGLSKTFYTQGCPVTQYGKTIPYTVPARKYSSIISQQAVDEMEQDDMDANGQANANNTPNRGCINTTDPFWEANDPVSSRCQLDANQSKTGHLEVLMTDINPSSNSYHSTAWKDVGVDETTCPHYEGSYPCLNSTSTQTEQGVKVYAPGTVVNITVTLNSSDPGATLTGSISGTGGGNIYLNGAGTNNQNFTVTVPVQGYISWTLTLRGIFTPNGSNYICSNIRFY